MQNKELFKEFVDFCDDQPKDKEIDHYTWETCAVGEFNQYKGRLEEEVWDILNELLGYRTELRSKVGNGDCPNTYGEFTKFLKTYL